MHTRRIGPALGVRSACTGSRPMPRLRSIARSWRQAYNGPFMKSELGSDTVRTSSSGGAGGAIQEEFDFTTNTIKRLE